MPLAIKLALLFVLLFVAEIVRLIWRAWRYSVNERKRERKALEWKRTRCVLCHGSGVFEGQPCPVCEEQGELSGSE